MKIKNNVREAKLKKQKKTTQKMICIKVFCPERLRFIVLVQSGSGITPSNKNKKKKKTEKYHQPMVFLHRFTIELRF
jgi:hypothetical protein